MPQTRARHHCISSWTYGYAYQGALGIGDRNPGTSMILDKKCITFLGLHVSKGVIDRRGPVSSGVTGAVDAEWRDIEMIL